MNITKYETNEIQIKCRLDEIMHVFLTFHSVHIYGDQGKFQGGIQTGDS